MQALIEKAQVLVDALPYIQDFRDSVVVIKFGGSAMEDDEKYEGILTDVTFMECVGTLPVIVHGGGKAISRQMDSRGIKAPFVNGLRVTSEAAIEVVSDVLNEQVNPRIVATIQKKGGQAVGLRGETVFHVEKHTALDENTGETMDWGFVGAPREVETDAIQECFRKRTIPVITPLGKGPDGKLHNVNADDAASAVAKALKARKLVFLSDVPGVLRAANDPDSIASTLSEKEVKELTESGAIQGGMLPKLQGSIQALDAGVRKVHIIDGRLDHSLLLEIFTVKGVGTEIVK
jgi:acetylglutamate kinase